MTLDKRFVDLQNNCEVVYGQNEQKSRAHKNMLDNGPN